MYVDPEDRHESRRKTVAWRLYAVLTALSAITIIGFAYLHSTGWGITIDLKKLADAFVVHGQQVEGTNNLHSADTNLIENALPATIAQQQNLIQSSGNNQQSSGMRPLNWNVQVSKFNEIFIQYPACDPDNMKWSQMECSNFRARAMKRFGKEWNKNAYWDGKKIIDNKKSTKIVNSELD